MNFSSKRIASLTSIKAIQSVVTSIRPGILSFFHNGAKIFMNSLYFNLNFPIHIFKNYFLNRMFRRNMQFQNKFCPNVALGFSWDSFSSQYCWENQVAFTFACMSKPWHMFQASKCYCLYPSSPYSTLDCCQKWRSCLLAE